MEFLRITPSTPEQVFVIVRNAHASSTMTPGHGVFWKHQFDPGTTILNITITTDNTGVSTISSVTCSTDIFDGYSVVFGGDTNPAPFFGAFAGVIAGRSVAPGDFGSIQVYGPIDSVFVRGVTQSPFISMPRGFVSATTNVGTMTTTTSTYTVTYLSAMHQVILRPLGMYNQTTESGASTEGYFGFMTLPVTTTGVAATQVLDLRSLWPAPYLVPIGLPGGSTFPTALNDATSTATIKAFIRCL